LDVREPPDDGAGVGRAHSGFRDVAGAPEEKEAGDETGGAPAKTGGGPPLGPAAATACAAAAESDPEAAQPDPAGPASEQAEGEQAADGPGAANRRTPRRVRDAECDQPRPGVAGYPCESRRYAESGRGGNAAGKEAGKAEETGTSAVCLCSGRR